MKALGMVNVRKLITKLSVVAAPLSQEMYRCLCDEIREMGVLDAVKVKRRGKKYLVLAGHQRLRAALEIGKSKVPCALMETPAEERNAICEGMKLELSENYMKKILMEEDYWEKKIREKLIPEVYRLYRAEEAGQRFVTSMILETKEFREIYSNACH